MNLPGKNQVMLCKNFLSKEECQYFLNMAPQINLQDIQNVTWKERTLDMTNHEIVKKVSSHLESLYHCPFVINDAQIQNWYEGSSSPLHIHNYNDREEIVYNSLIYLNDDYEGGEFYTEELNIKPEVGMLTLFNGQITRHGVKQVKNNNRYTLIFWWKK